MERDPLSRKLAVILHADVVGSTALVQKDESLAHERIQAAFNNFAETIDHYGGKAREIRGDALVAEFERASDAVTAAVPSTRGEGFSDTFLHGNDEWSSPDGVKWNPGIFGVFPVLRCTTYGLR
jgi:class 3 adenylate cyclase